MIATRELQPQHCRNSAVILLLSSSSGHLEAQGHKNQKNISMQQSGTKDQSPEDQQIQVVRNSVHLIRPNHAVHFAKVAKSSWMLLSNPLREATPRLSCPPRVSMAEVGTDTQRQLDCVLIPSLERCHQLDSLRELAHVGSISMYSKACLNLFQKSGRQQRRAYQVDPRSYRGRHDVLLLLFGSIREAGSKLFVG